MKKLSIAALLLSLPVTALASTILGNPNSSVVLTTSKAVYVADLVAYSCTAGSQTISFESVFHEDDTEPFTFDVDEYCSMDLEVRWTQGGPLQTVAVGGFTSLKVVSSGGTPVSIDIDSTSQTVTLN